MRLYQGDWSIGEMNLLAASMCSNMLLYYWLLCEYLCIPCFCLIKWQIALSRRKRTINTILFINISYIIIIIMAQTSGRVWHFGSICDAAVRNKCRTSSESQTPPPSSPPHTPFFFLFFPVVPILCNWCLVCGCPHYLFAADCILLDCCGSVVPLPLGLLVVHHFDLSGWAKYFFIPFKGTSKSKQTTTTKQQH